MIERTKPADRMPTPPWFGPAQPRDQPLEGGGHHEQPPEAVDHARDRGQHFDERRADPPEPAGGDLRQARRGADAEGDGDDHRDDRGGDGAVDEGQRAEAAVARLRVPGRAREEANPDGPDCEPRLPGEHGRDQDGQDEDQEGRRLAEQPEKAVDPHRARRRLPDREGQRFREGEREVRLNCHHAGPGEQARVICPP